MSNHKSAQGTIEDKLNKLLDSTFAYGVDWTEFRDKSDTDHEVATYATKIKSEIKAKLKETIQAIITTETTKARLDELNKIYGGTTYADIVGRRAALRKEQKPLKP